MYILGVSCNYHDAAAALIRDGEIIAAAQEERFTRKKHDASFPLHSIGFCLSEANIAARDLDYVAFYEKPLLKFERVLLTGLGTFPTSSSAFRESMIAWFNEKLWIKSKIMSHLDIPARRVLFVEHHVSHAASAFLCSPFRDAAIVTVDGVGEWATTTMGVGKSDADGTKGSAIEIRSEIRFPHSLGLLYSAFTAYLGFRVNNGEYKVMGMAPYGEPRYLDKVGELIDVADDGSFRLKMDFQAFHRSTRRTFSERFVKLLGPARTPEADFFTAKVSPERAARDAAAARENQRYADIAASIQRVTEDTLLKMARSAYDRTGMKTLCLAGGVALNSAANGRILRETPFERVFIQPAAGDAGGALGAALYVYHVLLGKPRTSVMEHAYLGQSHSDSDMHAALEMTGARFVRPKSREQLVGQVVERLLSGEVIALFQGRFEWGPRALGNRSILADPRDEKMKETVNSKIKFREPFRPFAPVVPEQDANRYFMLGKADGQYPLRFMLAVAPVRPGMESEIPAVSHFGTSRLQTVRREMNPLYYDIVEQFGEATGVPVLLNTSFNLRGEPIVASPMDALSTFQRSGIDALVLGDWIASKKQRERGASV